MEKEELKQRCLDAIDANRDLIIQLGDDVYKTPELGYKEFKTTERMIKAFQEIGEEPETEIAYTGCKVSTPKKGNTRIAVIGDSLDAKLYLGFEILNRVLFDAPGAPVKKALMDAQIGKDIQSIDVRQKFIGVLSDETAVGHNDGFQSGFMQQLGSVPNKLKTHSWFVIGKCNTDVSRFLPAQINC